VVAVSLAERNVACHITSNDPSHERSEAGTECTTWKEESRYETENKQRGVAEPVGRSPAGCLGGFRQPRAAGAGTQGRGAQHPIVIAKQGAFAFAGTVLGDPATQSVHCDHGYVEFQIPPDARGLPMVMWHSSSTKTWETTFADEDGFKNIFLRRGFSVYIIDPPPARPGGLGLRPMDVHA